MIYSLILFTFFVLNRKDFFNKFLPTTKIQIDWINILMFTCKLLSIVTIVFTVILIFTITFTILIKIFFGNNYSGNLYCKNLVNDLKWRIP
jgi:hypothetical protein